MWRVSSSCERHDAILFSDQVEAAFLERSARLRGGGRRHGRVTHRATGDRRFRPDSGRATTTMMWWIDEGDFATVDMALPLHQRVAILRAEAPEVMTR